MQDTKIPTLSSLTDDAFLNGVAAAIVLLQLGYDKGRLLAANKAQIDKWLQKEKNEQ